MRCEERFQGIYKKAPEGTAFCPYWVCRIGTHSDHQHGKITGFAITEGIQINGDPPSVY